jgi:nitroreductase
MEFRQVVAKRKMARSFEQRPVPGDVIDRILDVARRAPSGGFSQGFDFLVLDEPSVTVRFWELTNDPDFPYEAEDLAVAPPVLILPLSDKRAYLERYSEPDKIEYNLDREENWPVPYWHLDTAMAVMLMLLAAVDDGLGGWYFGIVHGERELLDEFGVPAEIRAIGAVGLGYAAAEEKQVGSAYSRTRRPFDDVVHRGAW